MSLLSKLRFVLALLAGLAVAGCATLPDTLPRGAPGQALAPQPGGLLSAAESRLSERAGPSASGFRLLDSNEDGLRWRLALIDSARHSLDLQYYVWWGDESGSLLMKRVLDAADRGVRVRLILDDLSTILKDGGHAELRDDVASLIDSHPNVEIRLFNAWRTRALAGRVFEMVGRMERINHRMHNKLLIADNRAAVIGGRNIGNEYFGLSSDFNFRDLDVLGIGPVARQASSVFDRFWNSEWVVPVAALGVATDSGELSRVQAPLRERLRSAPSLSRFPVDPEDWSDRLARAVASLHVGTSRVHTDTPDPDALKHHMPAAIRELLAGAKREVLITNAYIIPGPHALERMRDQIARGVRYRMLTNSLASHDVPAVNSHYKQWRRPLLEAGVDLHEMRADAAVRPLLADTAPTEAGFMGLHVKAIVIDRERVFVGSMNLDPRSWDINSEMGVVVDSQGLARELAASMERDMRPENAWRVSLGDDGTVRWTAGDRVLTAQPARSFWQRVQDVFFMFFPRDLY
ncbi:phospholipase D family protein [Burkholderiaceae bacterium FT117]|uniref:phospholipase D family protein n=1 Tax=Zeimonas sediminis TaxID=2944268 RepID=UPI002342E9DF|nr:phospholipase D family protein [Zeimonas sediminis]MCM5570075.1 phospholipase D family protein [Zeimonas sediminis]